MDIKQKKRAVIYCRVSTKEQVEEGNSLVTQEKNCKEYAQKNGYEVAAVFIEQGESAKTIDRTELKKLMSFCTTKKNNINAIIAYKIDRISRNIDDYSQIRITLKRYGVEIKSTSENFEDTPAGRFMENIIANVAQFDNDVRAERSIGGMKDAVREGRYVWLAPYGYSNVRVDGKATIAPNDFAPIIRKTFQEIALNRYPLEEIRKTMILDNLETFKEKPLSKSYFYRTIRNEIYTGWINKFGERHKGKFNPIISEELFEKVQQVLTGKRAKMRHLNANPDFPLRKFFKHSSGNLLTGCWAQGRHKKYPYYKIHHANINVRKELLENTFKHWLNHFKMDLTHFEKLRTNLNAYLDHNLLDKKSEQTKLLAKKANLKELQNAIINKNIKGVLSDEICKEKVNEISAELYDIDTALTTLPDNNISKSDILKILREVMLRPGDLWEKADFEGKLKLQWFYFPEGIEMSKNGSRTTKICRFFRLKELFLPGFSPVVNHRNEKSNTKILQLSLPPPNKPYAQSAEFWEEIKEEAKVLKNILTPKDDVLFQQHTLPS